MNSKATVLSASAKQFLDSVLSLQPKLAAFDCDGTLWSGDAGEGFFDWELKRGLVSDEVVRWARGRYAEYQAGRVSEDDMCGEMVTLHKGLTEAQVINAAREYFEPNIAPQIFAELQELVRRLHDSGCEVWAVSSTNEWVIREAMTYFDVAPQRILAATVQVKDGIVTDSLIRVPSGGGKPKAIREVIKRAPDAAFGNSRWDAEMLKMAKHAFAVNPHADLQGVAREHGWPIYFPEIVPR